MEMEKRPSTPGVFPARAGKFPRKISNFTPAARRFRWKSLFPLPTTYPLVYGVSVARFRFRQCDNYYVQTMGGFHYPNSELGKLIVNPHYAIPLPLFKPRPFSGGNAQMWIRIVANIQKNRLLLAFKNNSKQS